MKKNEIILFREYRSTVDELWDLKEEIVDVKTNIKLIEQLELNYKDLDNYNKKQQEDILKLFIIPNIESPTKEKIWKAFTFWCNTWQSILKICPKMNMMNLLNTNHCFMKPTARTIK